MEDLLTGGKASADSVLPFIPTLYAPRGLLVVVSMAGMQARHKIVDTGLGFSSTEGRDKSRVDKTLAG